MSLLHRASTEDFERAHDGLQALIERAPRHSSGYALKAQWYALRMNRGLSSSIAEDLRRAHQDSERAVAVDPENATAHTCRGLILGFFERDLEAADRCYARALALNPNEPMAWLFTATLRSWQGRGRESAAAAEQALRLSPLDPQRYYYDSLAAVAMLADDQYARAIELARRSLRVNRLHTSTYRVLAIAQMLAGDAEAARATVRSLRELEPQLTVAGYLARYPGAGRPHADRYAGALAEAGLPP
jgi:tetratricopeptide (TPR) repeat protein